MYREKEPELNEIGTRFQKCMRPWITVLEPPDDAKVRLMSAVKSKVKYQNKSVKGLLQKDRIE